MEGWVFMGFAAAAAEGLFFRGFFQKAPLVEVTAAVILLGKAEQQIQAEAGEEAVKKIMVAQAAPALSASGGLNKE